jgi:hypothetical protein
MVFTRTAAGAEALSADTASADLFRNVKQGFFTALYFADIVPESLDKFTGKTSKFTCRGIYGGVPDFLIFVRMFKHKR